MVRRHPRTTRTDPLVPYTTVFRSMNSSNPGRFVMGAALLLALTVAPTCGSAAAEPIAGLGTLTLDMTAAEVKVALDQRPAVVHEPAQGKNPERFRFGTRIDGRDYDVSARIHNGRLDNISLYLILPGQIGRAH